MKTITIILILILVCVSVVILGCVKKDESTISESGFNQDILIEKNILIEKSLNIEKQTSFTELKVELEDFKSFSDEFFPIWLDHINMISSMLDDFNNCTVLEEKVKNSKILGQKYLEFKFRLENVKPPSIALQANKLAIEAVSYRILFFKKFNENAPIEELNLIENQAYLAEVSFWDEIDRIYEHFNEEINRQGIGNDFKYSTNTVFNKV